MEDRRPNDLFAGSTVSNQIRSISHSIVLRRCRRVKFPVRIGVGVEEVTVAFILFFDSTAKKGW